MSDLRVNEEVVKIKTKEIKTATMMKKGKTTWIKRQRGGKM